VADHFQYLASPAMLALGVGLAAWALGKLGRRGAMVGAATGVILLATLGTLTWRQCGIYHGLEPLWRDTIEKNPRALMAYANLGTHLMSQGRAAEAAELFRAALAIRPDAVLWNDMGAALEMQGSPEAERFFAEAVRLQGDDADYLYNLGRFLVDHGRPAEALPHLEKAVRLKPRHAAAWDRLGVTACELGRTSDGLGYFRKAIEVQADFAPAHINLATALLDLGRPEEALPHAEQAVRSDPARPRGHGLLQEALAALGRQGELLAFYKRAVAERPEESALRCQLGRLLVAAGRPAEAREELRRAVQLSPDWPVALADLAFLLATAGDPALRDGREALRLAERACSLTQRKAVTPLDALAAAYAEMGRFAEAVAAAREAIAVAKASGQDGLASRIESRLKFYEAGQALRSGPPPDRP